MSRSVTPENLVQAAERIKGHVDGRVASVPTITLAEIEYDSENFTFDTAAHVLGSDGKPTGQTIQLDHIIDLYAANLQPS